MRIKASKGFTLKGTPHTARDSRCYDLVQREKEKYVFNPRSALRNGVSSCLERLFSPMKEQTKEESTGNRAVRPIKCSKRETKPLDLPSVQQQDLKTATTKHFRANQSSDVDQ